jgi:hypothetical protein
MAGAYGAGEAIESDALIRQPFRHLESSFVAAGAGIWAFRSQMGYMISRQI